MYAVSVELSHPPSYTRVSVVKLFCLCLSLCPRFFLFTSEFIRFCVLGQKQQHGGWPWPLPKRIWHRGAQWHDWGDGAGPPSAHAAVWGPGEYRHWEGLWQGEYWGTGAGWVRVGAINTGECVCVCDSWWGDWTNQEEDDQTWCNYWCRSGKFDHFIPDLSHCFTNKLLLNECWKDLAVWCVISRITGQWSLILFLRNVWSFWRTAFLFASWLY